MLLVSSGSDGESNFFATHAKKDEGSSELFWDSSESCWSGTFSAISSEAAEGCSEAGILVVSSGSEEESNFFATHAKKDEASSELL